MRRLLHQRERSAMRNGRIPPRILAETRAVSPSRADLGGMGHPRRLQGDNEDVKGLEALVVPLERFEFDSWEDLESYLAEYAKGGTPELPYPHEEHSDCTQCQDSLNGVKNWFVPDEWVNYDQCVCPSRRG
ncbi:hypothetical protein DVH05_000415 [Phytophthora capsici]|nr:hypothetical protein DVH05_000415 [Phytophthora capsici]